MRESLRATAVVLGLLTMSVAAAVDDLKGLFSADPNNPPINYSSIAANDAVSRLNDQLQRGEVQLEFRGPQGYLRPLLSALKIPLESQMLVFSKTSIQQARINPSNPRSLFFNDSVAVDGYPVAPSSKWRQKILETG